MNPPYSAKWSADKGFLDYPRFSMYGRLESVWEVDSSLLFQGYSYSKDSGLIFNVIPHCVLFRCGAEGKIRQNLLENGTIDTVIDLQKTIFYNTSISITVLGDHLSSNIFSPDHFGRRPLFKRFLS